MLQSATGSGRPKLATDRDGPTRGAPGDTTQSNIDDGEPGQISAVLDIIPQPVYHYLSIVKTCRFRGIHWGST
jgi:hypothetical protein